MPEQKCFYFGRAVCGGRATPAQAHETLECRSCPLCVLSGSNMAAVRISRFVFKWQKGTIELESARHLLCEIWTLYPDMRGERKKNYWSLTLKIQGLQCWTTHTHVCFSVTRTPHIHQSPQNAMQQTSFCIICCVDNLSLSLSDVCRVASKVRL